MTRLEAVETGINGDYNVPSEVGVSVAASQAIWIIVAIAAASSGASGVPQLAWYFLSGLAMVGFVVSAIAGYAIYLLVNRRNMHTAREQEVLANALDAGKSRTAQNDLKALLPLNSAERNLLYLTESSGEKSAILWGLLAAIPYFGWLAMVYTLTFLSGDLKKHEIAEDSIIQEFNRYAQAKSGQTLPVRQAWSAHRPSPILAAVCVLLLIVAAYGMILAVVASAPTLSLSAYSGPSLLLALILLTLGSVGFATILNVWLYWTITDPIPHLAFHRAWEPFVQSQLGPFVPTRSVG